jgi:hypothetical protein
MSEIKLALATHAGHLKISFFYHTTSAMAHTARTSIDDIVPAISERVAYSSCREQNAAIMLQECYGHSKMP